MDQPGRALYRRPPIPEFTVRQVREMRPGVQEDADRLIDDMPKQGSSADDLRHAVRHPARGRLRSSSVSHEGRLPLRTWATVRRRGCWSSTTNPR
ncbi:hypothetical protein ACFQ08_26700 [Streptosporangium algeriense]|uniref:Uncharacterized protein n=1 Tax=Streptosporangium algeriense TaxID=1682748 RepID=A0ABW3DWG3_9ACTN